MSEFFVEIKGSKQGSFSGESTKEGHEDQLDGLAFDLKLTSRVRGLNAVAARHPSTVELSFVKAWGSASPQLFQALLNDEVLTKVRFEFVQPGDAVEEPLRTIELKNARVVAIEVVVLPDERLTEVPPASERVSLSFAEMTIEHFPGQTVVSADAAPLVAESTRIRSSRVASAPRSRPAIERHLAQAGNPLTANELRALRRLVEGRGASIDVETEDGIGKGPR